MVKVSIIIPSWNRKDDLKRGLKAINKQTFKDFETIIVDNNSLDGTKEMLKEEFPKVKIIALKRNVGASRARNIGINNSNWKSEYVWFLDSDAYPVKNSCLRNMIKILEEDKGIGQVGGEIVDGSIRVPNSCRNQDGLFKFLKDCKILPVESIPTSNCIMEKQLIKEIGGFDPSYFYGYEDNEVSFKIQKKGYKSIIDSRVLAIHERSLGGRASTFYLWHRNRVRFIMIKESNPLFILFLPFIDIYTTLKLLPKKIEILKNSKVVSKSDQDESILKTGLIFGTSMMKAYIWAIIHFPQIMYIKITKPNFLKNEDKNKRKYL